MIGLIGGFSHTTTPAYAAGGIGYAPEAGRRTNFGDLFEPYGGWACYHCGLRFRHWVEAERHFGTTPKELPACIGAAFQLVDALRRWKERPLPPEPVLVAMVRVDRLRRAVARAKKSRSSQQAQEGDRHG